ncbi:MAG: DUF3794 domain-containing protein [Clostridiales bacterium]|nr:DUF3794 domain-containing protein [Clostridiales bacterium]
MDFKVISKAIAVCEPVFDDFDDRPVDCDFVLPDYCPDIAAVLKCTLEPVVQSKQLSGDRISADGLYFVRILYLDEERKCIRCVEFNKPFTSTFILKTSVINPCIRLTARTDYVNCRATSPRSLDIHGAFSVKLQVTAEGGNEVIASVHGEDIYTRSNTVSYTVPAAYAEKPFTVSEVLELGAGKPEAETLIRSEAVPVLEDCKMMINKAIIKGTLRLRNLYISDLSTGATEQVQHEIPFSQILDVEGLNDEWSCDVELDRLTADIHISVNQNGESRLLSVNVKLCARIQCYRSGTSEVVTDAYSARCPVRLETKPLQTEHLLEVNRTTCIVKQSLELPPDGIAEVIDLWCEVSPVADQCGGGRSALDGRMLICMLARDSAGLVTYYERTADFTLDFDDDCDQMASRLTVTDAGCNLTGGNQLEIRVELLVTRCCYAVQSCQAVCALAAEENGVFPDTGAALKIYYARRGESLWEIAKSCHTSMEAVMEENGLSADVLNEDAMLLVPLC